jgi:hypothetical protein
MIGEECCYSHTAQSVEHSIHPRTVSGWCWVERCSPWPAPFSPQSPPKIALLCSSGSSILWRGPTPPERARPPCGFGPSRTGLVSRLGRGAPEVSRFSCMLFLSVRGFFDYAGPTARSRLARKQPWCLPPIRRESASWFCVFRSSIARPTDTPVYASSDISRCLLQD